jgi:hypothetical protein
MNENLMTPDFSLVSPFVDHALEVKEERQRSEHASKAQTCTTSLPT